jgi:tetratricopeptide (TPR) repeat protein
MTATEHIRSFLFAAVTLFTAGGLIAPVRTQTTADFEVVPEKVEAYITRGNQFLGARRYDEAIEQFKLAIQASDRPYVTPYLNLGSAQHQKGDYQAAADSFRIATKIRPNDFRGHYNLAESLFALEDYRNAEAGYRQALRLSAGSLARNAHHFLGLSLYKQKRLDEAISEYKIALELSRGVYAEAHYNLGIALLEKKDYATAEREFRTALEQESPFPEARLNLGVALELQKQIPEAIRHYEVYLSVAGDTAEARGLKRRLAALKRAK